MRKFAPLLPLPFVFSLGAWGSARAADAGGAMLGEALAAVGRVVATEQAPSYEDTEVDGTIPVSTRLVAEELDEAGSDAIARPKRGKASPARSARPPAHAIFVSANTVLKLSETRATPRGVRVPADGARPAGLSLRGVEALGIGLRDGDVLTRALGQPALSSSAIIRAILVARARRVKVLEGEFYRGRERWILRVEQPYLEDAGDTLTGPAPGPRLPEP